MSQGSFLRLSLIGKPSYYKMPSYCSAAKRHLSGLLAQWLSLKYKHQTLQKNTTIKTAFLFIKLIFWFNLKQLTFHAVCSNSFLFCSPPSAACSKPSLHEQRPTTLHTTTHRTLHLIQSQDYPFISHVLDACLVSSLLLFSCMLCHGIVHMAI